MRNTIQILIITILLGACQVPSHFENNHRFVNNNWIRFNDLVYEVPVEAGDTYSFHGNLITDSLFQQRKLELGFYLYFPDGEKRLEDQTHRILDFEYKALGKKTDIGFELPLVFKKDIQVSESGLLKVVISNHSQYLDNLGIIGLDFYVEQQ